MKKPNVASPRPSKCPNPSQSFQIPHPFQDLTGIRFRTMPIPERVYDYVMKRDADKFRMHTSYWSG